MSSWTWKVISTRWWKISKICQLTSLAILGPTCLARMIFWCMRKSLSDFQGPSRWDRSEGAARLCENPLDSVKLGVSEPGQQISLLTSPLILPSPWILLPPPRSFSSLVNTRPLCPKSGKSLRQRRRKFNRVKKPPGSSAPIGANFLSFISFQHFQIKTKMMIEIGF